MFGKTGKIIACMLIIGQFTLLLPAQELGRDMRRGMARLEHYLDRAGIERNAEKWETIAQAGLEAAMLEWESRTLFLREQDGEAWEAEKIRAEMAYGKEKETAYVRWASGRIYAERARLEESGLGEALREAAKQWTYVDESGTETRIVNLAEAGRAQTAWQEVAREIIDRYMGLWEEKQGAAYRELEVRFSALGLDVEEKERIYREAGEQYRAEALREYGRIAAAEGNHLMMEVLYDQGSLRKISGEEAAGVIARELAKEAEAATAGAIRDLFQNLDELITAEDVEGIGIAGQDWLNNFRSAFETGLEKWAAAEEGFLIARAEWERDAEQSYIGSEEVWVQAYRELGLKQREWEIELLRKFDEGYKKWEESGKELELEINRARQDFLSAAEESRNTKGKLIGVQTDIYNKSRAMMDMAKQGIIQWYEQWGGAYENVYAKWRTVSGGEEGPPLMTLLQNGDISLLTGFKGGNVKNIIEQYEQWQIIYQKLVATGEPFNMQLWESGAELFDEAAGWISFAGKYRKHADEAVEELYKAAGIDVSLMNMDGYLSELEREYLKAGAVLQYWEDELRVAAAVNDYAQRNDSGLEGFGRTLTALEDAEGAYGQAAARYQDHLNTIMERSGEIGIANEVLEAAQAELGRLRVLVEEARKEYNTILAAMKGLQPETVEIQIAGTALRIGDTYQGVTAKDPDGHTIRTIKDDMDAYFKAMQAYGEVQKEAEIYAILSDMENSRDEWKSAGEEIGILLAGEAGLYDKKNVRIYFPPDFGFEKELLEILLEEYRLVLAGNGDGNRDTLSAGIRALWKEAEAWYAAALKRREEEKAYLLEGKTGETVLAAGEAWKTEQEQRSLLAGQLVGIRGELKTTAAGEWQYTLSKLAAQIEEILAAESGEDFSAAIGEGLNGEEGDFLKAVLAQERILKTTVGTALAWTAYQTGRRQRGLAELERSEEIAAQYGKYQISAVNQADKKSRAQVEKVIAENRGMYRQAAYFEEIAGYIGELRKKGAGLNLAGQEALNRYIAGLMEYAAVRETENSGEAAPEVLMAARQDQEKFRAAYDAAERAYEIFNTWQNQIYSIELYLKSLGTGHITDLAKTEQEFFIVYAGDIILAQIGLEALRDTEDRAALENLIAEDGSGGWAEIFLSLDDGQREEIYGKIMARQGDFEYTETTWTDILQDYLTQEQGEAAGILKGHMEDAVEKIRDTADRESYAGYLNRELDEKALVWFDQLKGFMLEQERVDNKLNTEQRAAIGIFLEGQNGEIRYERLAQALEWYESYFKEDAGWDYGAYKPEEGGPAPDKQRSDLNEAAAAYGAAVNGEAALINILKEQIKNLLTAKKGRSALEKEERAAKGKLEAVKTDWEKYSDGAYTQAIEGVQKSYAAYNDAIEEADAAYAGLKEARLLKREKQEIYEWAGSIYLKGFGEALNGGYGTPKEKLSGVQYTWERAQVSAEVLEGLVKGIIRADEKYTGAMKEYKEISEKYYLGLVAVFETEEAISRQKDIVRKAEFETEDAYAVLVREKEGAVLEKVDLVSLSKAGNEFQVSLEYTIQNGQAVRTGNPENDAAVYKEYFKIGTVTVDTVDGYREYSKAAAEARVWVEKILQDSEYMKNIMLAALYLNTLRQGDGRETWFGNSGDPKRDSSYIIADAPRGNFHGVDIEDVYHDSRMSVMTKAWKEIENRGAQGSKDLAYYLLFRDRNLLTGGAAQEKELLESLSAGRVAEKLEDRQEEKRKIAIAAQAVAVAAVAKGLYLLSLPFGGGGSGYYFALAAASQIIAINNFDAEKKLGQVKSRVRNFIKNKKENVAKSREEDNTKCETLIKKKETLLKEQQKLYLMMYGTTEKPKAGDGYTVSYDKFIKGVDQLFPPDTNQQALSHDDVLNLYNEKFYGEAGAWKCGSILESIGKLNSTYEKRENDKKEKLVSAANDLQRDQMAAAAAYEEAVSAELVISTERQKQLKELARLAGNPSLSVGERLAASAAYDKLMAEIRPAPETVKARFQALAANAWGDGTWNSELYDMELIRHEGSLLHSRIGYSRVAEPYTLRAEQDLAAVMTEAAANWSVSALEVKEKEWALLRKDYEKHFKAWIAQVYDIEGIAANEWEKAQGKLNEGYNKWRQNFVREYEAKSNGWEVSYLSFAMAKQEWVEDQYIYAANVGNAHVYEQLGIETETVIGKALYDLNIERMNREDFNIERYVAELLAGTDLEGLMNFSGSIADRGKNSMMTVQQGSRRSTGAVSLAAAGKVLAGMNEDMRNGAAKLAAAQAQKMLKDLMARYAERLREENKGMEEWERKLVGESGYSTDGYYSREVTIDSTLWGEKKERQKVHKYEYFHEPAPALRADLSAGNLNGLDAEVIMLLVAQTEQDLRAWGERIFGKTDEKGEIIEHRVLRGIGDLGAEAYAAADQREIPLVSTLLKKQANNTLTGGEAKILAKYANVRDGLFGAHLGYEPIMKTDPDYGESTWENVDTAGAGEIGLILLDLQWNSMKAMKGWMEIAKPAHDKKFWYEDNILNLTPLTMRSTVDLGLGILASVVSTAAQALNVIIPGGGVALGAALSMVINMSDDLLFGALDVTGGYKSMAEAGAELGKKAAMYAVSSTLGGIGGGIAGEAASVGLNTGNTIVLQVTGAAASSYTVGVANSYINNFDFSTGKMDWEAANKGWYSTDTIAGTLSAGVGAGVGGAFASNMNIAEKKLYGGITALTTAAYAEGTKYGIYAADSLINGSGSIGSRLGQAYDNMGGTTLNMANLGSMLDFAGTAAARTNGTGQSGLGSIAQTLNGVGLLEVNLGRNGVTSSIGMGGIDMGGALYTTAKRGIDMAGLKNYAQDNAQNGAIALQNYLYGDWTAENTSARIGSRLDSLYMLGQGVLGEEGYGLTISGGNGRNIFLSDQGSVNNNAIALQHESYRDGYAGNDNYLETRQAALAHTEMAARMMRDGQNIGLNQNLGNDLLAYISAKGDANKFNAYVDGNYDSSADYWKLIKKEDGSWDWEKDGSLDFNFDLNDKEQAYAFFSTFGFPSRFNKEGTATVSLRDMVGKEDALGRTLGIRDPIGTKYFTIPGAPPGNIALSIFTSNTKAKVNESVDRKDTINGYLNTTAFLKDKGVIYEYGGGIIDSKSHIVDGGSRTMDCTAFVSHLTQTARTSTAWFQNHPSFEKVDIAMPGDVIIYKAVNGAGKTDNHAVILLEGGKIAESSGWSGPRIDTQKRLEIDTYSSRGYTFTKQPYVVKR